MNDEQIFGWAMPADATKFHFFTEVQGRVMLESVCRDFYPAPWFWDRTEPLDRERSPQAEGNCVGCRAWLLIPSNRRKFESAVSA